VKKNISANPENIGFLGSVSIMLYPKHIPDPVEQLFRPGGAVHFYKRCFWRDMQYNRLPKSYRSRERQIACQ
jgi:hypothetical protein